ncbi:MAG: hypothetical protein JRD69_10160 [Deltaproteobacteria bacterium]|nr:hypothetical protein [Deltaproteobacteria bacterium]
MLVAQKEAILSALREDKTEFSAENALRESFDAVIDVTAGEYRMAAVMAADDVVVATRNDEVENAVNETIDREAVILTEASLIQRSTVKLVMEQVVDGIGNGLGVTSIAQAIDDVGIFGPIRALRISRTVTGAASSVGQQTAGAMAGAQTKQWVDSNFNVRPGHVRRDGETAPINGKFTQNPSPNGVSPRWPLDPNLSVGDRVNCRCSMVFS